MDLTNTQDLKFLLSKHKIRPNKRLGQNFLIDKNTLEKLVSAADINRGDTVIEVGPGIGTITAYLAKLAKKVIAVEKDPSLVPILKDTTKGFKNIEIVIGDALKIEKMKIDWKLKVGNWKLIGNIPYYLTAPLIRKFLEIDIPPKSMTLMVQKEMAQRICAKPPDMSILAVSVQVYAKPEIISYVPRSSFWPEPEVDSAIIRIKSHEARIMNTETERDAFFRVVKAGFSSPRKQLINNLSNGLKINRANTVEWLTGAGIAPERRAETLAVEEWLHLTKLSP